MSSPNTAQPDYASSWRRRWLGRRDYWSFQLVIWGLLCALWITASLLLAPAEHDASYEKRQVIRNLLNAAVGIAITHLLQILLEALSARLKGWRFFLLSAPAVLATSTAFVTCGAIVVLFTPPYAPGPFFARWMQAFTAILIWTGCFLAFVNRRRFLREQLARARLDVALKDAELRALRSQINPHFLFNSLNSLRAQIPLELERPRETVTRLAELLRAALGSSEYKTIPLSQELANVDNYLALEKLRYQSRLVVEKSIAHDTLSVPVPPFLLQSLVENAVNHGIAPNDAGGTVKIVARIAHDALRIVVINPGHIQPTQGSTKIGLKNAQTRLHLIFGDNARLDLVQTAANEVAATLTIPTDTPAHHAPAT